VSCLFQESISDKELVRQSGLLDLLEHGDEVMPDKDIVILGLTNSIRLSSCITCIS